MKRADPRSRTAVVAGKDRAAIMMGGYNPDQRWWWSSGAFVTTRGRRLRKRFAKGMAA
jgi:hypothetical protein